MIDDELIINNRQYRREDHPEDEVDEPQKPEAREEQKSSPAQIGIFRHPFNLTQ